MKNKSVKELADRLNEIIVEQDNLEIEYNLIVKELWERIPSLKESSGLQPKKKVRSK